MVPPRRRQAMAAAYPGRPYHWTLTMRQPLGVGLLLSLLSHGHVPSSRSTVFSASCCLLAFPILHGSSTAAAASAVGFFGAGGCAQGGDQQCWAEGAGRLEAQLANYEAGLQPAALAVGETAILLHPPLPLAAVSIVVEWGCQQNDGLADG